MKTGYLREIVVSFFIISINLYSQTTVSENTNSALYQLECYFKEQVALISGRCLTDINSKEEWDKKRQIYRRQLLEMLGLYPMPERTPLNAVVVGKVKGEESFIVEKLHFQSMPGLYVTANLYIPTTGVPPYPTVLYLCGHAYPLKPNYYHGNKVNYQHHAIWFARNGYVCLVVDTLQLGEIPGLHHGTYREGMWWWNSRGYTPAGIEAWNAVRAIDYLFTRSEVDTNRIGVTGRSGGGAYSWTAMAIDDRIKIGAPVAGITDLHNYVVDGTVEGHCDCMFFVNTYRWDYPQLAALAAPRPLLICNTDADSIFPLDGVERLHFKLRNLYSLLGSSTNIGLLIAPGPHKDIQELQVAVFRWFNRYLKGIDSQVAQTTTNLFTPEELKVFDKIPEDQINTNVHNIFVPELKSPPLPQDLSDWKNLKQSITNLLLEKSFAGWDAHPCNLNLTKIYSAKYKNVVFDCYDFMSQSNVRLKLFVFYPRQISKFNVVELRLIDTNLWTQFAADLTHIFGSVPRIETESQQGHLKNSVSKDYPDLNATLENIVNSKKAVIYFAPRGIGPDDWNLSPRKMTHILRRFMLIGQTLEGMRVFDIMRAVAALHCI
ncbi:MAG: alpha/beta hydrolase family protein, partial [Limisphaerales bacterium]